MFQLLTFRFLFLFLFIFVFVFLQDELEQADAFLVVYSCIDKESFTRAKQILSRLQDMDLLRHRPTILVANKIDLARSRAVSAQGEYGN